MSLSGKVVIVTGASAGIGAAIALKFAEEKSRVVIAARNETRLKEVSAKCEVYGVKPLIIVADVTKDSDVKKIVERTVEEYGQIDILINNAGIIGNAAIYAENAMEVFDRIMNTNLRSVVYLTNLASPFLIKTKGNIVNISSAASVIPISAESFSYCTSKAALDHFTRCISLDLGQKGVRVNTVNPGPVATDIVKNYGVKEDEIDEYWKKWAKRTILQRVSTSEEIADIVVFLASDKAKGITASAHFVDNGTVYKGATQ